MKTWYRSRGTMFWSLVFPIMLMALFGAIFGSMFDREFTLHVQDQDQTEYTKQLIEGLSFALEVKTVPPEVDIREYIAEKGLGSALHIPGGFTDGVQASMAGGANTTHLDLYLDPSQGTVNEALRSIIESTTGGINMGIIQSTFPGAHLTIDIVERDITAEEFTFLDFFLPGVIGLSILSSSIYGTIFRNTKYKEDGILRKLVTTPMRQSEWLFAMMLFMTFTSLISTSIIIVVGVLAFGVSISLNPLFLVIIVSAAFAFAGIGMIVSRFVHEEETADTAGGAIQFPMMFLSGTFFPLESLPPFLGTIARFLPLYYVKQGLRDSMIYGDVPGAILNTGIVLVIAAVFFVLGVVLTKWKE
jgi:ABC-2 type transport system permease protein